MNAPPISAESSNPVCLGAALNPKHKLAQQIQAFADEGFAYVDLAMDFPITSENVDAQALKKSLQRHNLSFHGQTPAHLPFGSPYAEIRKTAVNVAVQSLKQLQDAGARSIVFHPDATYAFASDAYVEWNAECLQTVVEAAGRIPILVENLPHGPFATVEKVVQLIEVSGLGHSVRLNLDVGHVFVGQRQGGSSLERFLQTGLVRHVHVSDNDGHADQHLPLSQGQINWAKIKQRMAEAQVGEVTVECYTGGIQGVLDSKVIWEKS